MTGSPPKNRRSQPDFLARRGGWMLLVWGIALVVLACVYAADATIAPIFGFTGVASFVLGILAARFEGDFELSATRLKGKLLAVAEREDLTLEDKGDELVRIAEEGAGPQAKWHVERSSAWRPYDALQRYIAFEEHVRDWFLANGWQVEQRDSPNGFGDFIAKRNGETALVEVKSHSRLSVADISRIRDLAERGVPLDRDAEAASNIRFALAVPKGSLTAAAKHAIQSETRLPLMIVEVPEDKSPDSTP